MPEAVLLLEAPWNAWYLHNRMAEAVSEKIGELQGMVRKRDQFVADFTHEIKTPMTSITVSYTHLTLPTT